MALLDLFRSKKGGVISGDGGLSSSEARSSVIPLGSGGVTLEDADAWARVFQSWIAEDAGKGMTVARAMTATPVFCAVMFLAHTMANIPRPVFEPSDAGPQKQSGSIPAMLNKSPNGEVTAFDFWEFIYTSMWSEGAGRAWIERNFAGTPVALWPLEYGRTTVRRKGFKKVYEYRDHDRLKVYASSDVLDFTFAFGPDFLSVYAPLKQCAGAVGAYINLQNYSNSFFKGGGVPPLALEGAMASSDAAVKRSADDVELSIRNANTNNSKILPIPVGYKLSPVAFEPIKGQAVEMKKTQIVDIAQAFQLGPVFLQELSAGKFNNIEQQDLNLVKHLIAHFANKSEQEINLKLFGCQAGAQYCKHNLDALQRGDFKTRIEATARAIQTSQMTPNEARALEERQAVDNPAANELHIQGATVPLGTVLPKPAAPEPKVDEE